MNDYSFLLTIGTVFMLGTMSPGPSFILIAKTAMGKSRKEGIGVAIGLGVGAVIFIIIAILGLYAILESIPFIYGFLKILGGMYLLYLAYKMWKYAGFRSDTRYRNINRCEAKKLFKSDSFWLDNTTLQP